MSKTYNKIIFKQIVFIIYIYMFNKKNILNIKIIIKFCLLCNFYQFIVLI